MTATYQAPGLGGLFLGRAIKPVRCEVQVGPAPYNQSSNWNFRPGIYTAKDVVREIAVLFESVIVQLGPDPPGTPSTRSILMDGLRSSLSHEGREATLLLSDWKSAEPCEITKQALRVGGALYSYASEVNHKVQGDPHLTVYSPCEGHKWIPPAGRLLRSARSSPILMMLYNEWLHQMTCLRDGLLPYANFEEVQLNLQDTSARGTRPLEEIRENFVLKIRGGSANRADFVDVAKVFTAPSLPSGGYGFQYQKGTVLPQSLFSEGRSSLLRYIPTALVEAGNEPVLFDFGSDLLTSSETIDTSSLASSSAAPSRLIETAITAEGTRRDSFEIGASQQLKLIGTFEKGQSFAVGIGRILRGLDQARHFDLSDEKWLTGKKDSGFHEASEILSVKGTLSQTKPVLIVVHASDPVVRLALIGKLEPGSVYLDGAPDGFDTPSIQKGRFVIVKG
ncbi:uncharacterized protein BDZ99DRAFT_423609 [Mytilinidion resinicola]|uniref:Uncharacterized protein n=1 Tax=Mytilinidion resinicola TaxID=574789 RepID=A0A6A6YCA2_9PEZI|nr:uncharacterized protein BDZ99DRAFT_423609 [Mytilinidion resinicola]KAF2806143.1 hypothetical protein BDZ99DRAFT_423609 [Mytilinidion resinicola]